MSAKNIDTSLWIGVSQEERAFLKTLADAEGVSLVQFVRSCINDRLAESGDDVPLLIDRTRGYPKGKPRPASDRRWPNRSTSNGPRA